MEKGSDPFSIFSMYFINMRLLSFCLALLILSSCTPPRCYVTIGIKKDANAESLLWHQIPDVLLRNGFVPHKLNQHFDENGILEKDINSDVFQMFKYEGAPDKRINIYVATKKLSKSPFVQVKFIDWSSLKSTVFTPPERTLILETLKVFEKEFSQPTIIVDSDGW